MKEYIYHYTTKEVLLEHILPNWEIMGSTFNELKDPKENGLKVKALEFNDDIRKSKEENPLVDVKMARLYIVVEYLTKYRVACFCTDKVYGNVRIQGCLLPRMWDQYGDKHKGICLQIDLEEFKRENTGNIDYIKKVNYTTELQYPIIDISNIQDDRKSIEIARKYINKNVDSLFFNKHIDWEGETELRAIKYYNENIPFTFNIKNSLEHIIVGMNLSKSYLPSIVDLIDGKKINISRAGYVEGSPTLIGC